MEKQLGHPTQGDPLRILKFKCQVWTSSESKKQENKDRNNVMRGLESSSYTEQRLLLGHRYKQNCRWLFKVAQVTWRTVSWKLGAVEQWNLVHIQMGPLRDSSHVHTNSISRGAHYQRKAADMSQHFPGCSMINTEQETRPSWSCKTNTLSWVVYTHMTVTEWMHPQDFTKPIDEQQRLLSVDSG